MKIYEVALVAGERSPFLPADELHPDAPEKDKEEPKKMQAKRITPRAGKDSATGTAKPDDKSAAAKRQAITKTCARSED